MRIMKKERKSGQVTRLKILQTARKMFLERGYSGTSMDDIAKAAEVNKSLIFHHFESKEQLWKMVKSYIVSEVGEGSLEISVNKGLKGFIEKAMEARFDIYEKHPDLARMIAWQQLEDKDARLEGTPGLPSLDAWIAAVKQLQEEKKLRSDVDAPLVLDFIFNQRPEKSYFEANPEQKQRYLQMIITALCAALSA
jgi:AcrR family transcriptional regulator